jgi:hypothetical protein
MNKLIKSLRGMNKPEYEDRKAIRREHNGWYQLYLILTGKT